MNLSAGPGGNGESIPEPTRTDRESAERAAEAARLADLMARSARGDEQAFAELYDLTSARIYGTVLRVLRSTDHAQEVTQEIFVEVWKQSGRYSPDRGKVISWMITMAHRRAVDRVRSVSSEVARDVRYALGEQDREIDHVWEGVERKLDVERVREGLESLTEIQRQALTLAYFGGYTQSQVAQMLNLPLGTVKTRIRDGLIGLRHALGVST